MNWIHLASTRSFGFTTLPMNTIGRAILFLMLATSCLGAPTKAQQEVTKVFRAYQAAVLRGDGEAAWSVLDSHTMNFYAQVQRDALSMAPAEFDRLDWMAKLMVARVRVEFRRGELQKLSGKYLFVLAVTNGWISKSTVESVKVLEGVAVSGRYATIFLPEAPAIPAFSFIQEGSEWKFALWKSFALANRSMDQMRKESGLPEKEFLLELLRRVSKYKVDEKVFDGPLD
jgi:hypothetical protein